MESMMNEITTIEEITKSNYLLEFNVGIMEEDMEAAMAFYNLANISNRKEEKRMYYGNVLSIYNKLGIDNIITATIYNNLGFIAESKEDKLNILNTDKAKVFYNLGLIGSNKEQQIDYYLKAIEVYNELEVKSVDMTEVLYKLGVVSEELENENTAKTYNNLGVISTGEEQYSYYKKTIEIFERLGIKSISLANAYYNTGLLEKNNKNIELSKYYGKAAHEIYFRILGPRHADTRSAITEFTF